MCLVQKISDEMCIFHSVCFIILFLFSLLPFNSSQYLNILIVLLNEFVSVAKELLLLFVIQCFLVHELYTLKHLSLILKKTNVTTLFFVAEKYFEIQNGYCNSSSLQ